MNLELMGRDIQELRATVVEQNVALQQDGVHIRALVRIAEIHERRLTHLEGDEG